MQNTCFKILSSFPHRHTHTTRTGIHKWHRTTVPISLLISPAIATLLCSTLSYKRSCLVLDSQRKCFLFSVDCQCDEMDKTKKLPVILDRKFFTVVKRDEKGGVKAKCMLCPTEKVLSASGTLDATSNFLKHLRVCIQFYNCWFADCGKMQMCGCSNV